MHFYLILLSNVLDIYHLADLYRLSGLLSKVGEFLQEKLTAVQALRLVKTSQVLPDSPIWKTVLTVLLDSFDEVMAMKEFSELQPAVLQIILRKVKDQYF